MKSSRRAKRMARHHGRNKKPATLNLVSLMDIFTIMVFFLMMNQSDVEVMNNDSIELPAATTQTQPRNTINLMVSKDDIVVQGRPVASIKDILAMKAEEELIPTLQKELEYLASKTAPTAEELELAVNGIVKNELQAIVNLGGILGFTIGILQTFILIFN